MARVCAGLKAPENITVSEWADKYRILSPENSAEAGKWKTSRTPYLKDIMDSFTDDRVKKIFVVASSQIGKTEMENCIIGYIIDQDPGTIVFAHPKIDQARNFSKRRIDPMIRDTEPLRRKVKDNPNAKSTVQLKTFPGGALVLVGTQSAKDLAETPARYVMGDEVDRWPRDVDGEGDPWGLLEARTTTFYNSKMVAVSTPTVKGNSAIESLFTTGTQEYWNVQCPECGKYHFVVFKDIKFDHETKYVGGRKQFTVSNIRYVCPACGESFSEGKIKKAPHKWIAMNPDAIKNGVRSYWLNGFSSPWASWESIIMQFLEADGDPHKLQTVLNTKFGELWEYKLNDSEDEETMLSRCEHYDAELPDGVLCLTCGVDTQEDRLVYEIVGYGFNKENWGIKRGIIHGRADDPETWDELDKVLDRQYRYADGRALKISLTLMDEGGHFTQNVREGCSLRKHKGMFAIKGSNQFDAPFTSPYKVGKYDAGQGRTGKYIWFEIGVSAGKSFIMSGLKIKEPGKRMSHFPKEKSRGYGLNYFNELLSEALLPNEKGALRWEKLPGHNRNEALDCRNYANAALEILRPDFAKLKYYLDNPNAVKETRPKQVKHQKRKMRDDEDWL